MHGRNCKSCRVAVNSAHAIPRRSWGGCFYRGRQTRGSRGNPYLQCHSLSHHLKRVRGPAYSSGRPMVATNAKKGKLKVELIDSAKKLCLCLVFYVRLIVAVYLFSRYSPEYQTISFVFLSFHCETSRVRSLALKMAASQPTFS